jgi:PAXNEB protein
MKDIPARNAKIDEKEEQDSSSDNLRIAFRYQDLPKVDSVQHSNQNINNYDLAKKCDKQMIENYENISYLSFSEYLQKVETPATNYNIICDEIQMLAQKNQHNLLRICIRSLASPNWFLPNHFSSEVLKFMTRLKSIVRYNNNIVCFVTVPFHLIDLVDKTLLNKIRKKADIHVDLESFDSTEKQTNPVFKEYNGLLHIKKMETLTCLQSQKPEAFDLAFKLKSHKLIIEKLHLPPELQENDSSEISMSCSSSSRGGNKSLDF